MTETGITLKVAGKTLGGWESVEVTRSMTSLCGSFSLSQSATHSEDTGVYLPIFPGDKVEVYANGLPVMVGWVDKVSPKVDGRSHQIAVSGREITCDLVDCGLLGSKGLWKKITLPQLIAQLTKPFGIKYSSKGGASSGDAFPRFSAEPGDTVFQTISKAAAMRGVLPYTLPTGEITLIQEGRKRATDRLVYGSNLKEVSGDFDVKDRFSSYTVRGQAPTPPGDSYFAPNKKMHVQAQATDSHVSRYRPMVSTGGSDLNHKTAQEKANWEAVTRAAKSNALEAVVQGWTQSDGSLWMDGMIVSVEAPYILGKTGSKDFLTSQVKFSYGSGGTVTTLSLVQTGAFAKLPEHKKAVTKTDEWAAVRKDVRG